MVDGLRDRSHLFLSSSYAIVVAKTDLKISLSVKVLKVPETQGMFDNNVPDKLGFSAIGFTRYEREIDKEEVVCDDPNDPSSCTTKFTPGEPNGKSFAWKPSLR